MKRSHSITVFGGKLEELSSIEKFPVFIGATDDPIETDIFSDLTFDICQKTGMIQLRNLVNPELVYSKFHSEAVGKTWETHHDLLAKLILKYCNNKKVLEIGGSDARLALKVLDNVSSWTIMEPNAKKANNPKITYIEEFFDNWSYSNHKDKGYNMILHSHVLEHSLHPAADMFAPISGLLKDGDYHIFSVPNLYKYLENKFVNTMNFEHTLFVTEEFIDSWLSGYGFEIIEKHYYEEHSIMYVTQKSEKTKWIGPVLKYEEHKQLYLEFLHYYQSFVNDLNQILEKTNKTVYLFGGHVFSQYLIALGLNTSKIECILDNSQLKRGKRLYGTNLMIKLPTEVKLDDSLIILKVGQYQDEIKSQLKTLSQEIEYYE